MFEVEVEFEFEEANTLVISKEPFLFLGRENENIVNVNNVHEAFLLQRDFDCFVFIDSGFNHSELGLLYELCQKSSFCVAICNDVSNETTLLDAFGSIISLDDSSISNSEVVDAFISGIHGCSAFGDPYGDMTFFVNRVSKIKCLKGVGRGLDEAIKKIDSKLVKGSAFYVVWKVGLDWDSTKLERQEQSLRSSIASQECIWLVNVHVCLDVTEETEELFLFFA
jgi:hypothetical protein